MKFHETPSGGTRPGALHADRRT